MAAYSKAWLERAALGFHPDTRAEMYEAPLTPVLDPEIDSMIGLAHRTMADPRAVSRGRTSP